MEAPSGSEILETAFCFGLRRLPGFDQQTAPDQEMVFLPAKINTFLLVERV
jgi:hypothetical protein